jgi:tetratricopeptide (TPR) repeat protein
MNKRDHPLYLPFLEASEKGDTGSLHLFKDPTFVQSLDKEEKVKLASLLLKKAEEAPETIEEAIKYAEDLIEEKSDVLLNISTLLYRFGVMRDHKDSLLLALGKMVHIQEKNPEFFTQDFRPSHLWGNLLIALHRQSPDESFIEQAIGKYEYSLNLASKNESALKEIYWDLGEAYLQLGERSKEQIDLKKACDFYAKAAKVGATAPHFWLDYGGACFQLGIRLGAPEHLNEAIHFFKGVIAETKDQKIALNRAWILYAHASKKLAELTHDLKDLSEADRVFQEALTTVPEEASLWLSWGELFIRFGWYYRDVSLLDKGLEKLTGLKTSECDPIALSSLLAQGLAYLGILLEDFRLIKEAEKRVETILTVGKNRFETQLAAGIASYARGCYFSDHEAFAAAYAAFEKSKSIDSMSIISRHMLFESSMAIAELKGDKYFAKKASLAAGRAAELAPFVPLFWNNWGVALLKLHLFGKKPSLLVEQAIEKFKRALSLSDTPDLRGLFHYGVAHDILGGIMDDEKSYEKAIDLLSQVLEKIPDSLTVRHQLALAYLHLAELNVEVEHLYRAVDLFESVVSQDNEDEAAYCGLGAACLALAQLIAEPNFDEQEKELNAKAEKSLLKAIELGNLEANYHLACLYSLSGLNEKALEYLERSALSHSLPSKEELLEDDWLEGVRETEEFKSFLNEHFGGGDDDPT